MALEMIMGSLSSHLLGSVGTYLLRSAASISLI